MTILLFLLFLDQAVSPTLTRQLARSAQSPEAAKVLRSLLYTLEVLSGSLAVGLGAALAIGAPFIARYWLANSGVPDTELITAIRLMGLSLACQWPSMLYSGGYVGLHRQDLLAIVRISGATVQSLGVMVLLTQIAASPEVYFSWIAITSAATSIILRVLLWRIMPGADEPARLDSAVLLTVWRFGAGNLAVGLTAALLTQSGGLLIAKYCTLDLLAAYALALNLANQLSTILVQPVSMTLMPHFARLDARREEAPLAHEYHRWTQIIALLVIPISGTLIVFARPLLQLWLGTSSPLVDPVAGLLILISIGTLFNTLMTPPYFLQIACGWTRLSVVKNIIALAVILPALEIAVPRYGPIAAAVCWIGVNLGYYLFEVPLMHRRLLPRELWKWWGQDTMAPMIVGGVIYAATGAFISPGMTHIDALIVAVAVAAIAWMALLVVLPLARADLFRLLRLLKRQAFG
jgi:O-antigen/teichoic acid export membrane protein